MQSHFPFCFWAKKPTHFFAFLGSKIPQKDHLCSLSISPLLFFSFKIRSWRFFLPPSHWTTPAKTTKMSTWEKPGSVPQHLPHQQNCHSPAFLLEVPPLLLASRTPHPPGCLPTSPASSSFSISCSTPLPPLTCMLRCKWIFWAPEQELSTLLATLQDKDHLLIKRYWEIVSSASEKKKQE